VVQAASGGGGAGLAPLLMIVLLFGVMYFMMIRPQQKRRRQAEQMQASLTPGSEVVTIGGLYGTVVGVDDDTVTLEVSPGVHTRYDRRAVARVISGPEDTAEQPAAEPAAAVPPASPVVDERK
jgi:preprotein translocase subunit YajC